MKSLIISLLVLAYTMPLGRAAGTEALRAENCTITALDISETGLNLSFTGRWTVLKESALVYADIDKNGLVVIRDKDGDPAAWQALCDTAQHALSSHSAVTITSDVLGSIRGGRVIFRTPPDQIKITPYAPH